MMTEKQKIQLVRRGIKAVLYIVTVGGVFLILSSILGDAHITIRLNWVKCLIGLATLFAVSRLYAWTFPCKKTTKKEYE